MHRAVLLKYVRPQSRRVALMAILLLATAGLQLLGPQLLGQFIDTAKDTDSSLAALSQLAFGFIGVALLTHAVSTLAMYVSETVGWKATNQLRADLVEHCLMLDLGFHQAHTPGEQIERVDGDVAVLANFFSQFSVRLLGALLFLTGLISIATLQIGPLGLALAVYAGVALWLLRMAQQRSVPAFATGRQASAELNGFWNELGNGLEDIAGNRGGAYMLKRYSKLQRRESRADLVSQTLGASVEWVWQVLSASSTALVLAIGAILLGQNAITLGTVYLLFNYTTRLADMLYEVMWQFYTLQEATASLERVTALLGRSSRIADGPGMHLPAGSQSVAFADVSFRYTEEQPVLTSISFELAPGQTLGLIGRTGSGKSTIAKLLARFYDPQQGTIQLGGQDIRAAQIADLRRWVGFVPQEVQLLAASLRDNLACFDPAITDARLLEALEQFGLGSWFRRLPDGFDTQITSNQLSAGEAQLLACVRVALRNPRVVVLDEASSRLDRLSEQALQGAIARLLAGRTAIIIAHRLSTLEQVDRIIVLEAGQIIEDGPRETLARNPQSRYAMLLQTARAGEVPL